MKRPPFLPVFIGTGFGSGFSPFAPGTAGALLASIIWIAFYFLLPFSWVLWLTAAFVIVFTFAGIWAADKLETYWGEDPSRVVVDEMVGVWIPLLAVPNDSVSAYVPHVLSQTLQTHTRTNFTATCVFFPFDLKVHL